MIKRITNWFKRKNSWLSKEIYLYVICCNDYPEIICKKGTTREQAELYAKRLQEERLKKIIKEQGPYLYHKPYYHVQKCIFRRIPK